MLLIQYPELSYTFSLVVRFLQLVTERSHLFPLPSTRTRYSSSLLTVPPPDDQQNPVSPQGTSNTSFTFALSEMEATVVPGGTVKIVDSTVFEASQNIAAALVTVEPGAMRLVGISILVIRQF